LAQAQRNLLLVAIDPQHDGFDILPRLEHVGRFGDTLGPGEFGDVDESFDARFEFDEGAVRHEVDDLAFVPRTDGIFVFDIFPRVGQLLFEAEADTLLFPIDVEHDDIDLLSDLEDFGGMPDPAPAHVGDVEQSIQTIEIDESAEVGDVLDGAFADVARG